MRGHGPFPIGDHRRLGVRYEVTRTGTLLVSEKVFSVCERELGSTVSPSRHTKEQGAEYSAVMTLSNSSSQHTKVSESR